MKGYSAAFWDQVSILYGFNAVTASDLAIDLGLDRQHLRTIARKMDWEKADGKPKIPALKNKLSFLATHTLDTTVSDRLKAEIEDLRGLYLWLLATALLLKEGNFSNLNEVMEFEKATGTCRQQTLSEAMKRAGR